MYLCLDTFDVNEKYWLGKKYLQALTKWHFYIFHIMFTFYLDFLDEKI